jgi:hypothetical protein
MSNVFSVLSASWSISQIISNKKAIAFCESLEERSPDVFKKLRLLHKMHKEINKFDDRSFHRYVVDLLYVQTKHSLADKLSAGRFETVCDSIHGCGCCDSWNNDGKSRAFEQAKEQIKLMIEGTSFELFHEFAELAVQNEEERQKFFMTQSLREAFAVQPKLPLVIHSPNFQVSTTPGASNFADDGTPMYD